MLTRIGDVEIWRVLEGDDALMPLARFFPGLTAEALAPHRAALVPHGIAPHPETGEDWIRLPVQAFLLRTPRRTILVDACVGDDKTVPHLPRWHRRKDPRFMAALAAAGAAPEDVDLVLCTHLHVDHVGWTTRWTADHWVPTFPNARVLTTAADLAFAEERARLDPEGAAGRVFAETLGPLIAADLIDTVEPDHQPDEAVRLRSTPGHTPGHVSVEILASGAPEALVTGDFIHSPLQCALPDLSPAPDADKAEAASTRRGMLEELAETRRLTLATHFPLPSIGRVARAGAAFAWIPLD
ncbi:MAG TPA: MBL fold metallo-hydrolase [Paracoccaceae bacterium]|nr:MBL fold metallo-hydrolase [Paracoccaceae bacterium]